MNDTICSSLAFLQIQICELDAQKSADTKVDLLNDKSCFLDSATQIMREACTCSHLFGCIKDLSMVLKRGKTASQNDNSELMNTGKIIQEKCFSFLNGQKYIQVKMVPENCSGRIRSNNQTAEKSKMSIAIRSCSWNGTHQVAEYLGNMLVLHRGECFPLLNVNGWNREQEVSAKQRPTQT